MNKKILTILGIVLLTLVIAGLFFGKKQSQKQGDIDQVQNDVEIKKENQQKQVNDQDKDDLVWYEIPELNIKFLMEKEIANLIKYRDFYVQSSKANGKELYVQDVDDEVFGEILVYNKNDKRDLEHNINMRTPTWDTICTGLGSRILFKNDEKILCYNNLDRTINTNSLIIRKIFNNYLSTVDVELINN